MKKKISLTRQKSVNISDPIDNKLSLIKTIKKSINKIGFFDNNDLIFELFHKKQNLGKIINYTKNNIPPLIINNTFGIKKYYINRKKKSGIFYEPNIFTYVKKIGKGSYNRIYKVKSEQNILDNNIIKDKFYVLREQIIIKNQKENYNTIIDNTIEAFIHTILSIYQTKVLITNSHYRGKYIIPAIYLVAQNKISGMIYSIIDQLDNTLYDLLKKNYLTVEQQFNLFLEAYYQLSCGLEIFQKKFKYNHNDLKINNIFYKWNKTTPIDFDDVNGFIFFLGDFGASYLEIDNEDNTKIYKLWGNSLLAGLNPTFRPYRDLLFLLHSAMSNVRELESKLIVLARQIGYYHDFKNDPDNKETGPYLWHYLYLKPSYPLKAQLLYTPSNIKNKIKQLYPLKYNSRTCSEYTGERTRFEIKYRTYKY